MPKLMYNQDMYIGCDPEFFFRKGKHIIGSEKVLPEHGIADENQACRVVRDGIQAELNPYHATCRQNLATNIRAGFIHTMNVLKKKNEGKILARNKITIDFSPVVEVSEKELSSLGAKSQTFGCAESMNAQQQLKKLDKISKIGVNPKKYLKRSAGGHIHLGFPNGRNKNNSASTSPRSYDRAIDSEIMVPILDIIVGNTCVMLDRDSGNVERRKVYGRAGEYREPLHGLEYRTLSNFWLRHPALMSLVTGLARTAVEIVIQSNEAHDYAAKLRSLVNMNDIEKAINTNDYDLALSNWNKITPFLNDIIPLYGWYPINTGNVDIFNHFIDKELDYWFTRPPLAAWTDGKESEREGFCAWMHRVVYPDLQVATKQ